MSEFTATPEPDGSAARAWPAPLQAGSLIALVAPSGPSAPDRVDAAEQLITELGFRVRRADHLLDVHDRLTYLAGSDQARAADFEAAWTDPAVEAVWAVRGGYGAQRMIDLLDFDRLRSSGRKQLIGFSDITALHARVGRELDQITVHAPIAIHAQLLDPVNRASLITMLSGRPATGTELLTGDVLVEGRATGRLIGGNLSLIASDVGIEPAPRRPSVVIFEDIDEETYRVDRMITQLRRVGWFDSVTGVVLGEFSEPDDAAAVDQVLTERLSDLGIPVLWRAPVGHGAANLAVPLGAEVELTVGDGRGVLRLS